MKSLALLLPLILVCSVANADMEISSYAKCEAGPVVDGIPTSVLTQLIVTANEQMHLSKIFFSDGAGCQGSVRREMSYGKLKIRPSFSRGITEAYSADVNLYLKIGVNDQKAVIVFSKTYPATVSKSGDNIFLLEREDATSAR